MPWLIAGFVVLVTTGFAKLSTVVVNRLLAVPQPKSLIGFIESIQVLLIAAYAWVVAASLRRRGFPLLSEVAQQDFVGDLLMVLIAMGLVGFLILVRSAVAYQSYRPPACQIGVESQVFDARQGVTRGSWAESLVGPGPMRRLALLPGNQQFTVEVSTKRFALSRLPIEWNGLSIVHFSDSHFRGAVARAYFEFVCQKAMELAPDLFLFTGDLLDDISLLNWLPETLGRLKAPLGQYFILGNHDWYLNARPIRREMQRIGWVDVAGRTMDLHPTEPGPMITLAGDETPWMGTHPDLTSQSQDRFRILLSHTPDNIHWARDQGVHLMLSGHTHGGQIRLPVIGPVYSPSRFGCRFASGVFWLEPTLLHVSRGLSGREPIRYQCRPELTKLVLTVPICDGQPIRELRRGSDKPSCQP